jgi:pimeloyl-ACP methyl ester carboxylesterase
LKISAATTDPENLIYDADELDAARVLAVMVPGALSRISVFEAAEVWRARGYGLAHYRFPGLDGRSVAPVLDIAEAASEIVALAARYPDKPVRLLGFSTGGAIVLTAAAVLGGDVRVALLSSAVARGGGAATFSKGLRDVLGSAVRARSVDRRAIWLEYYKVLLFGRAVLGDPALDARANEVIAARRDRIVFPDEGKPRAHTRDLRRWSVPAAAAGVGRHVRLFWGMADPVFSLAQQRGLARSIGAAGLMGYPGQGHLLFASHPAVFEDIFAHFEGATPEDSAGIELL